MGCASSGPLSKNLVEGANDIANLGGNALHGISETAKGGIEQVKEKVESTVHGAEHCIENMIGKFDSKLGHKKEEVEELSADMKKAVDGLDADVEDALTNVSNGVQEEVSEAETILASDTEETKQINSDNPASDTETLTPSAPEKSDLQVEDIEESNDQVDGMGSTVHMTKSVHEMEELKTSTPESTTISDKKDE